MTDQVRIAALHFYPLKSAHGIDLERAALTAAGIADDRRWMLVTEAGRFLTQRELPRMALIRPQLSATDLVLRAPGMPEISIAMSQPGAVREVTVWNDRCTGVDAGDAVADWLRGFLGRDCRLVRFDPSLRRISSRAWTGDFEADVRFSDAFPLLLMSLESLADLNRRLDKPLPMNRFRPNIVLAGLAPYDEDRIEELSTDGLRLRFVKPCTRCRITTTNQETGELEGDEPLRSLKGYRYDATLRGVCFGQNAIVIDGAGGALALGQTLRVHWRART